ncbi:MAG TPA: PGPGW domain-containing protein [Planctomycetota bacterium]|nr:PGPGW domain-containing protein [Planctomycetota bacterium]
MAVAVFLVRIPPDYFLKTEKPARSALDWAWKIGKNVLGWVFLLAGVVMLPLPGPGSLVIVLGLSLVDFPGRARLVRAIISRPGIARVIDWLRSKFGRPPLLKQPPKPRAPRTAPALAK